MSNTTSRPDIEACQNQGHQDQSNLRSYLVLNFGLIVFLVLFAIVSYRWLNGGNQFLTGVESSQPTIFFVLDGGIILGLVFGLSNLGLFCFHRINRMKGRES